MDNFTDAIKRILVSGIYFDHSCLKKHRFFKSWIAGNFFVFIFHLWILFLFSESFSLILIDNYEGFCLLKYF